MVGRVVAGSLLSFLLVAILSSTGHAQPVPASGSWLDRPPTSAGVAESCPQLNQWLLLYWGGSDGASIGAAAGVCGNADVYWLHRGAAWLGFRRDVPAASDTWTLVKGEAHFVHGATAPAPVVSHGGPVRDYVSFVDALRGRGLTVEPAGEIRQPFFTVPGRSIKVNGEDVQVFEFATEAAAAAAAAQVPPGGSAFSTIIIDWIAPPYFYRRERIIVLYVGTNDQLRTHLSALLGPHFAGGTAYLGPQVPGGPR